MLVQFCPSSSSSIPASSPSASLSSSLTSPPDRPSLCYPQVGLPSVTPQQLQAQLLGAIMHTMQPRQKDWEYFAKHAFPLCLSLFTTQTQQRVQCYAQGRECREKLPDWTAYVSMIGTGSRHALLSNKLSQCTCHANVHCFQPGSSSVLS